MSPLALIPLLLASLASSQQKGAVLGIVRDSQTHQPLEGVKLYLVPYDSRAPDLLFPTLVVFDGPMGFETTTDVTGRYGYSDLPPHRYYIGAEKQGYSGPTDIETGPKVFRVAAGQDVQHDLLLDHAPILRGRFVDSSTRAPINGLKVIGLRQMYTGGMRQWTTGFGMKPGKEPGEFEMPMPPRVEFYLEIVPAVCERIAEHTNDASAPPFYGRSYYPGVTDLASATPIMLAPGEDRYLDIRLPRRQPGSANLEIAGAAPGAKLNLALERTTPGYFPPTVLKTTVNHEGPLRIERLSASEYTLIAWTVDNSGIRTGAIRRFSADQDAAHLRLDLVEAVTLRGVVRVDPAFGGEPPSDAFLQIIPRRRENPENHPSIHFRPGQVFAIPRLLAGDYQLYGGAPPGWVVSRMEYGTTDAIHHAITVNSALTLVVTLSRGFGTVSGHLTGPGRPETAAVVLVPEPIADGALMNTYPWTHIDDSGGFEFTYVLPGRYRVIPFYGPAEERYMDLDAIREHPGGYRDVQVLPGKTVTGIDFAVRR